MRALISFILLISAPACVSSEERALNDCMSRFSQQVETLRSGENIVPNDLEDQEAFWSECKELIRARTNELIDRRDEDFLTMRSPREAYRFAQTYANSGDYARAEVLMSHAYRPEDQAAWNMLIDANRAFLRRDKPGLQQVRSKMLELPEPEGFDEIATSYNAEPLSERRLMYAHPFKEMRWPVYLEVVDGFLACFDRTYSEAYSLDCRPD